VSVDTGGTFTDVVGVDTASGRLYAVKTPSVREDPSRALMAGVEKVLEVANQAPENIELVIHGTTTATNAVLEHEFDGIGLLVTHGFRHLIEIARQSVPDGYGNSFFWVKPPRIVPLHLVREVPERLAFDGSVLTPLDEEAVVEAARELVERGVNRLGVCLLHAYANDVHERRIAELLEDRFPDLFVSISSVVLPEYREYERAMTTLIDVMVKPYCKTYLNRAQQDLTALTGGRPFLIMQSNGGVVSAGTAGDKPVTMLLSGPAGGVLGAIAAARAGGLHDIITLDVGGTSTDVALIENLTVALTNETVIESYPVKVPMIDIATVGTGGGSIAWCGPGDSLKVGPKSAGAKPGPICYGRGGAEPTVTDAALVLGRLPEDLVGGELHLDRTATEAAFKELGDQLGLSPQEAAAGVLEVAVVGQVAGIRQVSTMKGRDPSVYTLVAFGGAGPLLANEVAEFLGIKRVLVPPTPGNLSAFGLQVTDVKRDYVRTSVTHVSTDGFTDSWQTLEEIWQELERSGREELAAEGVPDDGIQLLRGADLRYVGEGYEVTVTLGEDVAGTEAVQAAARAFHAEHDRIYGFSYPGSQDLEIVSVRVQAVGHLHRPEFPPLPEQVGTPQAVSSRSVFWRSTGWVDCPIYARADLGAGGQVSGPAVVEEYGSTVVIPSHWTARIDSFGNIISERKDA
jgi:N-methylhydantoinase A